MTEYHVPNAEEFQNGVKREFAFLTANYGFKESSSPLKYDNPYSVTYKKKRIFIYVEGLSYGYALGVDIGRLSVLGKLTERISLGYIVSLRKPELLEPTYPEKRGQLESMKISAMELREVAEDFLQGDFSGLPEIKRHIEDLNEENRRKGEVAELRDLEIKASKAFHSGEYEATIELLSPVSKKLGKAGLMLLSQAKKRMSH